MKKVLLILILSVFMLAMLLLFGSCCTQKCCNRKFPPEITTKHDSTTIQVNHDSIILIPPDSSWLYAFIKCDSLGQAYISQIESLKTGKPEIQIQFKDKLLYVNCKIDSQKVYLKWSEKITKVNNSQTVKPQEIKVNYITGWQWFQIWCGRILWVLIGATIIGLIIKYGKIL